MGDQSASKRGQLLVGHHHSTELWHQVGVDLGLGSHKPLLGTSPNGGEGAERGRKWSRAWNITWLSGVMV